MVSAEEVGRQGGRPPPAQLPLPDPPPAQLPPQQRSAFKKEGMGCEEEHDEEEEEEEEEGGQAVDLEEEEEPRPET